MRAFKWFNDLWDDEVDEQDVDLMFKVIGIGMLLIVICDIGSLLA